MKKLIYFSMAALMLMVTVPALGQPFRPYDKPHSGHHSGHHRGRHGHGHGRMPAEVPCLYDWQELWNGCHVRINLDRISIYTSSDERIIWADEVYLLPSGYYKVRNGDFWYIHSQTGTRVNNLWGDAVDVMPNGLFRCYRAGRYIYYDAQGNERK